VIPSSVEILGSSCFSFCQSLSSFSFGLPSQLKRIESHAFDGLSCTVVIPCTVLYVASYLNYNRHRILFSEGDSFDELYGWLRVRESGISVDFRRMLRLVSEDFDMISYQLSNSVIEEMGEICASAVIGSGIYQRFEDESQIVVKSISLRDLREHGLIKKEIERLINLCHPCIAALIGFVFAGVSWELKVLGLSSESEILFEVLAASPVWWTPTAKAKAIAGIVLGLRFSHSLGLIHGHLTTHNIVFDLNHHIQITDFVSCLSGNGLSGFSREGWNPETDVRGFMSILFEIVVGYPAKDDADMPADVPTFVCEMIKSGLSDERKRWSSFRDIFETLERHDFKIVPGVDSAEVLSFVGWVEELEQNRE
jgi:serine/threonine protein kinase